ncbi:MAG: hypothetical protein JEZ00_01060 [Anaerolineaceae bacterium]|nr:hypothetical protein [Anaerolineaceae bacterium]
MKDKVISFFRYFAIMMVCCTAMILMSACSSAKDPLTFQPELFTQKNNINEECILLVDDVLVSFLDSNSNNANIRVSGVMNQYCSNLQVGMDAPDIGKNIAIAVAATTTNAAGLSDRPFEVELNAKSLRFGNYTVWVNGEAETIFSID